RGEREEERRRGRHAQRRRVVLGDMQRVEAEPVVGLGELQAVLDLRGERLSARVDVVEDAEFHSSRSRRDGTSCGKAGLRRILSGGVLWLIQKPWQRGE